MSARGFSGAEAFQVEIRFHGDLARFLRASRGQKSVLRQLSEKTSVKDTIEACGVPHPEIDLILVNGEPVNLSFPLQSAAKIEVYPYSTPATPFPQSRLQRRNVTRFVADGHLGKLTRDLRLLGVDVVYDAFATDPELVAVAVQEERGLLTRDRPLLMHGAVETGYYPRAQVAVEQTREVLRRFDLKAGLAPFTRCLRCNGLLAKVSKAEVLGELQPLTKLYYQDFRRCQVCGQIYWGGSHSAKLELRVAQLLGEG